MGTQENSPYTPEAITGRVLRSVATRHPDVSKDKIQQVVNQMLERAAIPHYVDILAAREIEEKLSPTDHYQQAPEETLSETLTPITIFDRATHAAANVINAASRTLRLG